jgi:hypothetical protein
MMISLCGFSQRKINSLALSIEIGAQKQAVKPAEVFI